MTIEAEDSSLVKPETLPDEPATSLDEPEITSLETDSDQLETPTPVTTSPAESQIRPWGYFVAGMVVAVLAVTLGAVLGYLARPTLDSAAALGTTAPRPVEGTVSVAGAAASTAQAPIASIVAIVQSGGHSQGASEAPIVIVEYSDFQCPYCGRHFSEVENRLKEAYVKSGQVRLVYKHLTILGDESVWAALASECAADQNKFWEYHDLIFSRQNGENQGAFNPENLKSWAAELGLDPASFNECLDSKKHLDVVQANTLEAKQLGIRGTPGFFVNDLPIAGAESFEVFQQVIDEKLKALGKASGG
ncbi:MAG: thioredoxin domain-containing protein [Anaerolineae bacterium]|nr:thioredoxin domain-containing protein [Anaerolineae bacterium]